jgi:hypothetical protein
VYFVQLSVIILCVFVRLQPASEALVGKCLPRRTCVQVRTSPLFARGPVAAPDLGAVEDRAGEREVRWHAVTFSMRSTRDC